MDRYESIDIGEAVSNLSGSMTAAAEDVTQSAMQIARGESDEAYATKAQLASALNAITALATKFAGTNGGYIVINTDANNQTSELLILVTRNRSERPARSSAGTIRDLPIPGMATTAHIRR